MKIILQEPPVSTQHIYQYVCFGKFPRMYMTAKGKKTKQHYQEEIRKQYKGKISKKNFEMEMILYFKDKRRRDIDNYSKQALDSLEGIVMEDDKQIQQLLTKKFIDKKNPRTEITLNEL